MHRGESGRLSVGFTGSASYELLPRLLRAYRQRFPGVAVEPRNDMLTARQLEAVEQGRLDVGFVRATAFPPPVAARTVWREPLVAVLPVEQTEPVALTMVWRDEDRSPATRNFLRLVADEVAADCDA